MDENLFRDAYRSANPLACVFEKALLSQTCQCALSSRVCVADRQGVACTDSGARSLCEAFLNMARERSRFLLRLTQLPPRLPHAQEIRVQLGSLRGASALLTAQADPQSPHAGGPASVMAETATAETGMVADVSGMLGELVRRHGAVESIPMQEILGQIAAVDTRRRRR